MSAKDNIIVLPDSHLRQRSKRVGYISDEIKQLVEDMQSATLDWEAHRQHEAGIALAAIQIGKPLRVIILRKNLDDKDNKDFNVFINPVITKLEGTIEEDFEGCLSVPDVYGKVPRYSQIRVRATDLSGKEVRIRAEGFLARVFQHEVDHTNGVVFTDHIKDTPEAFYSLGDDGHLIKLEYEKDVRQNPILWK